jgi:hypothetical protein
LAISSSGSERISMSKSAFSLNLDKIDQFCIFQYVIE